MRSNEARASRRQLFIGLIVLPLSLLPFIAYGTMTPEGRLLKDKAELAVAPPQLGSIGGLRAGLDGAIPMYRNAVMPLVYHGVGFSDIMQTHHLRHVIHDHLATLGAGHLPVRYAAPIGTSDAYVDAVVADPRYALAEHQKPPKKVGSHLVLLDCLTCDKCLPVCPNDANFSYEIEPLRTEYKSYRVANGSVVTVDGAEILI